MSGDRLSEATRALREQGEAGASAERFTRARVMASLHQHRVRRRTRMALLLPIAATFVATSAWGVSSGRAQGWLSEVRSVLGFAPTPAEETAPSPKPRAKRVAPERAPAPRPQAAPPAPEPAATPLAESEPAQEPQGKPAVRATSAATVAPSAPPPDPELDRYRNAHRAHFVERNPGAALAAWDEYLEKSPSGRFALEARYNRALCLVRLERRSEARAALEPFARGAFGGYRQREAGELLDALGD